MTTPRNSEKLPFSPSSVSRRQFLKSSALAAAGVGLLPGCLNSQQAPAVSHVKSANEKINIAVIGSGGKGGGDTDQCAQLGENIVALCDVDRNTLASRGRQYPQAKRFEDYRKMLEEIGNSIDAVIVSTPDHHHAFAASMAMKMGKHVYCQKPLTHSVFEARLLRRLARENKIASQMGNQGSAGSGLRRSIEIIQSGLIGKPLELHVWSNRPIWPQGIDRPPGEDPVPANLNWDQWIGPAPMRPFKGNRTYHDFAWRGWRDFGTGALGDMACHTVNMPFRALKLGYPNVVECEATSELHPETYPKTSRIRFEFPAREGLPPLKFWWYDGNPQDKEVKPLRPNPEITREVEAIGGAMPASGCLVIGDRGKLYSADDYGGSFFFMLNGEKGFRPAVRRGQQGGEDEAIRNIPQTLPRLEGGNTDQLQKKEWIAAMRGGPPAFSNFDIAAYLTEIILLGCVAMRVGVGKRLDWDGPAMRAKNSPESAQFVHREYRKGWTL